MFGFNKLSLKKKLLSIFTFSILASLTVMAILILSQFKLGALQDEGASRAKDSDRIAEIASEVSNVYALAADAIINQNLTETKEELKILKTKMSSGIDDVLRIVDTEEEKKQALEFKKNYETYLSHIEKELIPLLDKKPGLSDEAKELDGKIDNARDETLKKLNFIYKSIHDEALLADQLFDETFKRGIRNSAIITLIGISLSIVLITLVINGLTTQLRSIANYLKESGDMVSAAATQIAASAEELSQATTEQASSLQETSSSVEEINSMVSANTENAKQSSKISSDSLNNAEKGQNVVTEMINAVNDIDASNASIMNQIDETNKQIENIVNIINEIGSKTKVINEIVFQTKLLSFNASVEAARAGEMGKGFAVVAEEVGNLANMSGTAALEITSMLENSTTTVERIVKDSKEKTAQLVTVGKQKIDTGNRVAKECGEVLSEIVYSVANVSKMINEISNASQEQSRGVQEITKAVSQLDQVTQQNSINAAESANAAGALSNQAENLNQLVQKLVTTIEGAA